MAAAMTATVNDIIAVLMMAVCGQKEEEDGGEVACPYREEALFKTLFKTENNTRSERLTNFLGWLK